MDLADHLPTIHAAATSAVRRYRLDASLVEDIAQDTATDLLTNRVDDFASADTDKRIAAVIARTAVAAAMRVRRRIDRESPALDADLPDSLAAADGTAPRSDDNAAPTDNAAAADAWNAYMARTLNVSLDETSTRQRAAVLARKAEVRAVSRSDVHAVADWSRDSMRNPVDVIDVETRRAYLAAALDEATGEHLAPLSYLLRDVAADGWHYASDDVRADAVHADLDPALASVSTPTALDVLAYVYVPLRRTLQRTDATRVTRLRTAIHADPNARADAIALPDDKLPVGVVTASRRFLLARALQSFADVSDRRAVSRAVSRIGPDVRHVLYCAGDALTGYGPDGALRPRPRTCACYACQSTRRTGYRVPVSQRASDYIASQQAARVAAQRGRVVLRGLRDHDWTSASAGTIDPYGKPVPYVEPVDVWLPRLVGLPLATPRQLDAVRRYRLARAVDAYQVRTAQGESVREHLGTLTDRAAATCATDLDAYRVPVTSLLVEGPTYARRVVLALMVLARVAPRRPRRRG